MHSALLIFTFGRWSTGFYRIDRMFIDGIGISEYRSFGSELQKIGPFNKVNLFIGQNNSGKSNILRFLRYHYRRIIAFIHKPNRGLNWELLDYHLRESPDSITLAFALKIEGRNYQTLIQDSKYRPNVLSIVEKFLRSETLTSGTDTIWFTYELNERANTVSLKVDRDLLGKLANEKIWTRDEGKIFWDQVVKSGSGNIDRAFSMFTPIHIPGPEVSLIPAFRKIEKAEQEAEQEAKAQDDFNGRDIIDRLARLQQPDDTEQHLKLKFAEINEFLGRVTGNPSATLDIPYTHDKILVHMDDKTLPLDSLGTGIHETIILAAAATILENQVICIEEPELHLHPSLQKKLIRYLQEKTSNQYFITTHSAHLLDTPEAAIFHVRLQNNQTTVDPVYTAAEKSLICVDLGYRASDLLQANCIIWVEGPSDRIYLNHWIQAVEPDFTDGLHYSIMFYGGRLLSYLSGDDPEVDEFISLRRLNRYISIMIDRDRENRYHRLTDTKRRVRDEFNKGPGFAWVTKGREIENYVAPDILESAIKAIYPKAVSLCDTGPYAKPYFFKASKGAIVEKVDKIKIARKVTECEPNLDVLDLKPMINKLVKFIHSANDLD